jgi:hypothetical protein
MMTSVQTSFPRLFTEIDQLTRSDHWHLAEDDVCWFLGDFSVRKGWDHSPTNNLIWNFKKPMNRRGKPGWQFKAKAITDAATAVSHALQSVDTTGCTFVPIPPSGEKGAGNHDDRVMQMLRAVRPVIDARELVIQIGGRDPAHLSDGKRNPDEHVARYRVNEDFATPAPSTIIICDDVLRTGCQFKAMKTVLHRRFRTARIQGLFLARCLPNSDLSQLDWDF